ncbi:hypothetical protein [Aeromonas veronii]|uniref:hypothetical protein n=1 Tax=Aeromonas veronii TaxID=654 RepID=UPI0039F6C5E2
MSGENEVELIKMYKAAQEKYIYFLMAAAGSGIGFAIVQTKVEKLAYHHALWGLSVVLWALSFLCGLQFIEHLNSTTFQNANYLGLKRDLSNCTIEQRKSLAADVHAVYQSTMDRHQQSMEFFGKWQMYLLLSGALCYVVWHIYKMYLVVI